MLSTNDCYPGCGCDFDIFQITRDRVKKWDNKDDYKSALIQINQLMDSLDIDIGDLQIQTGIPFQSFSEFVDWLVEWKNLISNTLVEV